MLRTETDKAQYLEVYRGRLALARGATDEAREIFLAALDYRSGRQGLAPLLAELAELGARTGDVALYERFGAQALELGWRSGARKSLAQATRARAIIAIGEERFDDALTDVENALQIYQSLGTTWEEARTRYVLAGLYRRRASEGDAALAQTELARALALFDALRAVRDIARARAALAGGDIRLP
jgi:tetratricopeptide (TPR) repeat protein